MIEYDKRTCHYEDAKNGCTFWDCDECKYFYKDNLYGENMLKTRIFNFFENSLPGAINEFERVTGRKPEKLECNVNTGRMWFAWAEGYLPFIQYEDELPKGIICKYDGIPVEINETLDNGTINIK